MLQQPGEDAATPTPLDLDAKPIVRSLSVIHAALESDDGLPSQDSSPRLSPPAAQPKNNAPRPLSLFQSRPHRASAPHLAGAAHTEPAYTFAYGRSTRRHTLTSTTKILQFTSTEVPSAAHLAPLPLLPHVPEDPAGEKQKQQHHHHQHHHLQQPSPASAHQISNHSTPFHFSYHTPARKRDTRHSLPASPTAPSPSPTPSSPLSCPTPHSILTHASPAQAATKRLAALPRTPPPKHPHPLADGNAVWSAGRASSSPNIRIGPKPLVSTALSPPQRPSLMSWLLDPEPSAPNTPDATYRFSYGTSAPGPSRLGTHNVPALHGNAAAPVPDAALNFSHRASSPGPLRLWTHAVPGSHSDAAALQRGLGVHTSHKDQCAVQHGMPSLCSNGAALQSSSDMHASHRDLARHAMPTLVSVPSSPSAPCAPSQRSGRAGSQTLYPRHSQPQVSRSKWLFHLPSTGSDVLSSWCSCCFHSQLSSRSPGCRLVTCHSESNCHSKSNLTAGGLEYLEMQRAAGSGGGGSATISWKHDSS